MKATIQFEELDDFIFKLTNICQLIDGWHNDGTPWTEFDENCRKYAKDLLERFYQMKGYSMNTTVTNPQKPVTVEKLSQWLELAEQERNKALARCEEMLCALKLLHAATLENGDTKESSDRIHDAYEAYKRILSNNEDRR